MKPIVMIWVLRVRETVALLETRQHEYKTQAERKQTLDLSLAEHIKQQEDLQQEACELKQQQASLDCSINRSKRDLEVKQTELVEEQKVAMLKARQRAVMAKVQAMKDACSTEARAAKGYTADVKQHMMIAKSKQTAAEEALSKITAELEEQERKDTAEDMDTHIAQTKDQLGMVCMELQQLQELLNSSQQANALTRTKIDMAKQNKAKELKDLEARRASVQEELFQVTRQQTVNDTRLNQLHSECSRLHNQQTELDTAIQNASNLIDQLASSCDL
eukprot:jgi/Chrzof1/8415/Cz03g09230.t1